VVLTGDDAASFSHLLAHECVVDPTLTLRGLHLLYLANARPPRQSKARAPRGGHEGKS
jgi:type III pantothenate kinase